MMHLAFHLRLIYVVSSCLVTTQAVQQRKYLNASEDTTDDLTKLSNSTVKGKAVVLNVKSVSDSLQAKARSDYFAICVCAKDQHDDIQEWVEHYERIGAGKLYVFDDSSSPSMLDQLKHFIQSGLVEYHFIGQSTHSFISRPQLYVYDQCIARYRSRHQFIAFIDVDEFLFLTDPSVASMLALLHEYEDQGGLAVNWVLFGSSGHIHKPHGGTIANYWKCVPSEHPESLHIKTLYVDRVSSDPHHFLYHACKTAVNEKFETVKGPRSSQSKTSRIALYHYVTKSRDEYSKKIERGSAMKNVKTVAFYDHVGKEAVEECRDAMHAHTRQE